MTMATRKRGNGEGSITKSANGLWQARLTLADGRRKAVYGKTRQEAFQKLTAALRDRDRGLPIVAERQTVGQYAATWLEAIKPTLRLRTWQRYRELLTLHVVPTLGKVALAKLTPPQVHGLYAALLAEARSPNTVRTLHAVLHKMLDTALRHDLVPRNVCDLVDAPRPAPREMRVLNSDQVRQLLAAAEGTRLECLFTLALATGLRIGELLGLQWQDVGLATSTLYIQHSLQRIRRVGYRLASPKTKQSRRRIKLGATALEALRAPRPAGRGTTGRGPDVGRWGGGRSGLLQYAGQATG